MLRKRPVELIRMTYAFRGTISSCGHEVWSRTSSHGSERSTSMGLKPMHPALNSLLFSIVKAESQFLRVGDLPFGSSIMAVARKVGG